MPHRVSSSPPPTNASRRVMARYGRSRRRRATERPDAEGQPRPRFPARPAAAFLTGCLLAFTGLTGAMAPVLAGVDPRLETYTVQPMEKAPYLQELEDTLYETERMEEAEAHLAAVGAAVQKHRDDVDLVHLYLSLHESLGQKDEAVAVTEAWLAENDQQAEHHLYRGLAADGASAAPHFERALELSSDLVAAKVGLANALLLAGSEPEAERARTLLFEAVDARPDHPDAWIALAGDYRIRGELASAVAALERAALTDPADPSLRQQLLAALQEWGTRAQQGGEVETWAKSAAGTLSRVGRAGEGDPHFLFVAARVRASTGNPAGAIEDLRAAAELGFADWNLVERDRGLAAIRGHAALPGILETMKQNRKNRATELKAELADDLIDQALPSGMEFPLLEGGTVRLADLRGKVVILDFWATWCGPCRQAFPLLQDFYRTKPEHVEVICVNVFERDGGKQVAPFWKKNRYPMPVALGTRDQAQAFGVQSIPHLFVIDPEGRVRYVHKGYTPYLAEELSWVAELILAG